MSIEPTLPVITPTIVDPSADVALSSVIRTNSLAPDTAQSLQASFLPLFTEARGILEKSRDITVTDASQKLEMKLARECRLALRTVRVTAEKLRKDLKEESVRKGRAIDGFNNILLHLIETEESRLEQQENFVERQEATRKAQIKAKREEQLSAFGVDTRFFSLSDMDETAYQQLLSNTIAADEKRKDDAKKSELARIEKERADAEERERVRVENERLRREAVEREEAARVEREKAEADKKAADAVAKREREAMEAKHAEERRKAELAAKAEREAAAAEAAKERAAREKAEAELKAQKEADAKAARAEQLAAKKAAAAPDKEKLAALAKCLDGQILPDMATDDGKIVVQEFLKRQHELIMWLKDQAESL